MLAAVPLCMTAPGLARQPVDSPPAEPDAKTQPGSENTSPPQGDAPALTATPSREPLAEGTFVPSRTATLVRGARGGWYAVFHPQSGGALLPAMGLLPNPTLERIESIALSQGGRATVRISGQVYTYRGRNYLLAATAIAAPAAPMNPTVPADQAGNAVAPPAPPPAAAEAADPSIEQLIRELEAPRQEPRAIEARPTPSADPPTAEPVETGATVLAPPGQFLVRRRVRVVRVSGTWAAVFDSDPPPGLTDAPLFLAPCSTTEGLEPRAAARGDALIFEMSGRVTSYRGRNWVLPSVVQPFRLPDVMPMQ